MAKPVAFSPKRGDAADDLVAEDEGELGMRQLAVENVQVGATHPAGGDLDQDLTGPRLRHLQFGAPERLAGRIQHHRPHDGRRH